MPVSILPETKRFKVLCVFIANYGVNNEKSEMRGLPGVLKMLTMVVLIVLFCCLFVFLR